MSQNSNEASVQSVVMPVWRCFHCSFETSDHAEAKSHFGDSGDEVLCLFWASMDDAERAHEYQQMVLELNAAREEEHRLRTFIRERVADRSTMLKRNSGYHARRICLEAEKLLCEESA